MGLIVTVFWKAIGKVKVINVRVVVSVERPHHDCVPLKYKKIQKLCINKEQVSATQLHSITFVTITNMWVRLLIMENKTGTVGKNLLYNGCAAYPRRHNNNNHNTLRAGCETEQTETEIALLKVRHRGSHSGGLISFSPFLNLSQTLHHF